MTSKVLITFLFIMSFTLGFSQVGISTLTPDPSSILDIESTTAGVLIPRLSTTERDAISSPANSLMIFNTTANSYQYNSGTTGSPLWVKMSYNPSIKYSNTNITTNINTNIAVNIPIFGSLEWNDDTGLYSVSGNTVTLNDTGKYRITFNISYRVPSVGGTSDQRVAVEAQLAINGTLTGTIASTGYIRHANGHVEASLHATEVLTITSGDVISLKTIRSANSASSNMRSVGTSNIFIEKL